MKNIYAMFNRINGTLVYSNFTTEENAYNELKKAGYRVISRKKEYSNDNQTIFICYR